jgi:hypothetical protein
MCGSGELLWHARAGRRRKDEEEEEWMSMEYCVGLALLVEPTSLAKTCVRFSDVVNPRMRLDDGIIDLHTYN